MSDGLDRHEVRVATLRQVLEAVEPFARVGASLYSSPLPDDHVLGVVTDGAGEGRPITKGQVKAAHVARCRVRDVLEGRVIRPSPRSAEALEAEVERLTRIAGRVEDEGPGHDVVQRLRGRYACGPHLPNGDPEFGWRQFQATPINLEAALVIEGLRASLAAAEEALAGRDPSDGTTVSP